MSKPVLAIGPANYAGQAFRWAQAVNNFTPAVAWSFQRGPTHRASFAFESDRTIPAPLFHTGVLRRPRSTHLFRGVTHICLDGYQPYFRLFRSRVFGRDATWLDGRGYRLALIAHGTDIRDPDRHLDRDPWSMFREGGADWLRRLRALTARNQRYADELGLPLYVSTPDLLLDQPSATWLPLCVDIDRWASQSPVGESTLLRVLHLPSRRNPPIKGTQYIEPVLERLHEQKVLEWVRHGPVAHEEMPRLVADCDVVIDQILVGSYGVAAVEALAAGRVVVGRIAPEVAGLMPERPPIVDADPNTLEDVLRHLAANVSLVQALSAAGPMFVGRWHSGEASARALMPFLFDEA